MTPHWHDNDNGMNEADLQAYVDGQLEGRRRAEVEAFLAATPAESARLAAYRDQNIALHALFDPSTGPAVMLPPQIENLARRLERQLDDHEASTPKAAAPKVRWSTRRVAASVALLISAGAAGWLVAGQDAWRDAPLVALTRQASDAPVQLASNAADGRSAEGENLQVAAWLAAQSGDVPQQLPDLESLGFELATQRVIRTASGLPAAQLLYQDESGRRVTLYMRAGGTADQTTFTFTKNGESAQFFWQDAHMGYSLVGKMPQDKLLSVAEEINRSLREKAEPPAAESAPEAAVKPMDGRADETIPAATGAAPGTENENPDILPAPLLKQIDLPKET